MKIINRNAAAIVLFIMALAIGAAAQTHRKPLRPKSQSARVLINEQGYAPGSLRLHRSVPARITFLRVTDRTCGTEIDIPAFGVHQPLPLNEAVVVSFTPTRTGEFGFACGMNMLRGHLIVQ